MKENLIIELSNGIKYVIIDCIKEDNKKYFLLTQVDDKEEKISAEDTNKVEVLLPSEEIKPIQSDSSVHIFSPKTGFCFESYLESRLDNELNRAIASEFDLSLFVFRIPSIQLDYNNETLQKVCKYLTTEFQFKDLLFEYDEDCLIGIKNNMNLDTALTFADKLYSDITEIVKENDLKCYIGISTRTVRIITGKRLLTEATEALKHALEDENNPIIAFRANAEKYRKMMQEK
jgi:GGDEF domain-containing protein